MKDQGEQTNSAAGQPSLRMMIEALKENLGTDPSPDLVKQLLSDLATLERQNLQNHFAGRQEYSKQVAELKLFAHRRVVEYAMQTLKWLFLLNAGAIAIVLTYVGSVAGKGQGPTMTAALLLSGIWPFVVGCICVALAGAASFFNFIFAVGALPTQEYLHLFVDPKASKWPMAHSQRQDETAEAFRERFSWRIDGTQYLAIALAFASAAFFTLGVIQVLHAANTMPSAAHAYGTTWMQG